MPRYFIEVAYKGNCYSGFQIQKNANSIQAEVQKSLSTIFKTDFKLTASSRTDAGVHALQNYFHFDSPFAIETKLLYNLNALLPADIAARNIFLVKDDSHCRFDAVSRRYEYHLYQIKNPFLKDRAYYYPYTLNIDVLNSFAKVISDQKDFTSFSKRKTQVKTYKCNIFFSAWSQQKDCVIYTVEGNRFLRGMVRGLVGTMLRLSKACNQVESLEEIFKTKDATKADFSVPAHGLFLTNVKYDKDIFGL